VQIIEGYLVETKNLSIAPLQLLELVHVVPEAALSNNLVGCKDAHSVDRSALSLGLGFTTTYNLVLVHRLDISTK
jgi:hypothetical protein